MNLMQRVRANIAHALGGRNGHASASASNRAAPPPVAVPLGSKQPRSLTARDFAPMAQVVNRRSPVARHTVPRGEVFELKVGAPLRLYVMAQTAFTVATNASGEALLTLGAVGEAFVRSTRAAPAGGFVTPAHPDVMVYEAGTPVEVVSVDFDAGEIAVTGATASTSVTFTVYMLPRVGDLSLRAVQPSGVDQRSVELYNASMGGLAEMDQASGRTAPYIDRPGLTGLPLGPKWALTVEVNTPFLVDFSDPLARHELRIPGAILPVSALDERAIGAVVAGTLLHR